MAGIHVLMNFKSYNFFSSKCKLHKHNTNCKFLKHLFATADPMAICNHIYTHIKS